MAEKTKKDAEEYLENEEEEFNDIDENFGLPDLDPQLLDDLSEESTEEPAEEEIQEIEQVAADDFFVSEDSNTKEDQATEEATFNEEEYQEETIEEEAGSAYVPGTYAAKTKERKSASGKIAGFVVVVLLLSAAGWFFFYYQPAQEVAKKIKQEQIAADKAKKDQERIAVQKAAEAERLRAEQEARMQAEKDTKPEVGVIETISEKTNRYYVVVSSGLDDDMAMDYAKKEMKNGTNIKLLSPLGMDKFYRVTVADHDTWTAAENAANDLKSTFGDDVWVLKY